MQASQLNKTFIPKDIIRKSSLKNQTNLLNTRQFQKTGGNPYIQFEPIQLKFNGYQVGKPISATLKIINKAPIPQRVHILPPTQPGFSIKVNKKGAIAAGMSENIVVTFVSEVYKYQYDIIKVNTETDNFVVPIYAYPSIPKIRQIFPRLIDFGNVQVNSSDSNIYPIVNPVPLDFQYQFCYLNQSPAFIITPFKGIIQASSTQNIEITFIPSDKVTYTVQAVLTIKQFDFQPIAIKIMGSGKDKKQTTLRSTKRIKSSRLNPLSKIQKQGSQILEPVTLSNKINQGYNNQSLGLISQKKSFMRSRTSYPKLLKKNVQTQNLQNLSGLTLHQKIETNAKKQNEKQYLSRFTRVADLDKEKQVKFVQYLGDYQMTLQQLQFEQTVNAEYTQGRLKNLEELCCNRAQNQINNQAEIEYKKYEKRDFQWDINKNDDLKLRKQKLELFMKAGSKIIQKYRLQKRLKKIRKFLSDCNSREDVAKKVEQDYQKSLDAGNSGLQKVSGKLGFSIDNLTPSIFALQFNENGDSIRKIFKTEGKPEFDDDGPLGQIKLHETERMGYNNTTFPSDFVNLKKQIPATRHSAQQQLPLKTTTLPTIKTTQSTSLYEMQLKIPTHYFICNNFDLNRYKSMNPNDEKSLDYLCNANLEQIEDEFEGWSHGDHQVLRTKLQRNMGSQFTGISLFNYSDTHDVGFLGQIGSQLPKQIGMANIQQDDHIQDGDSDDQHLNQIPVESGGDFLSKIQQNSAKAKQRRQMDKQFFSYENKLYQTMQKNILQSRLSVLSQPIDKIKAYNKWAQKKGNQILI